GTLHALASRADVATFFQARLEQLQVEGCRNWRYTNLDIVRVGARCVLATMDWEPLRADDSPLGRWRQTYQLLRTDHGLRFVVSTVHAQ
ncbi:MAG TPA: hypothetical protein VN277_02295, partial [Acidiferrobacterales bacterium]|nr:hypothetical protein [Acidiferrobacterales bacterium]